MKDRGAPARISGAIHARMAALFGSALPGSTDRCSGCPDAEICRHARPCPLDGGARAVRRPGASRAEEQTEGEKALVLLARASRRRLSGAELQALRTHLEDDLGAMTRASLSVMEETAGRPERKEPASLRGEAVIPRGGIWIAGAYHESLEDYAQSEAGALMNDLTHTAWPEDTGKRWTMQYETVARYTARVLSAAASARGPCSGASAPNKPIAEGVS